MPSKTQCGREDTKELEEIGVAQLDPECLNIVVACSSRERYIGAAGDLPWGRSLRGDMLFMSRLIRPSDTRVALIMGRRTYASLPLMRGIEKLVLSRSGSVAERAGTRCFTDLNAAWAHCRSAGLCPVVFGGTEVYAAALAHRCKIWCTVVEESPGSPVIQGDRVFPGHWEGLCDVTERVALFLSTVTAAPTWDCRNGTFCEAGYTYKFYSGYTAASNAPTMC